MCQRFFIIMRILFMSGANNDKIQHPPKFFPARPNFKETYGGRAKIWAGKVLLLRRNVGGKALKETDNSSSFLN